VYGCPQPEERPQAASRRPRKEKIEPPRRQDAKTPRRQDAKKSFFCLALRGLGPRIHHCFSANEKFEDGRDSPAKAPGIYLGVLAPWRLDFFILTPFRIKARRSR
jgi:hypothetical protein